MARERKKKKKPGSDASETAERIVSAALLHPDLGPDRLARLIADEGESVTPGLVYRTLCARGLQTRSLRRRFLEERHKLGRPAESRKPQVAPAPPQEPLHEKLQEPAGPPVAEPALEYHPAAGVAAEGTKPEIPAGSIPAYVQAPAGRSRIRQIEKTASGNEKWFFRGANLLLSVLIVFLGIRIGVRLYDERQGRGSDKTPLSTLGSTAVASDTVEPIRSLSDYRVILDRNLFGSASNPEPDAAREAVEVKAVGLAGKEVGLKLIGTAVAKDRRLNYAVLEVAKNNRQEICREKDTVANVVIKRIFRNNVIILTAEGEKRLSVDEKLGVGTAASAVQPAAAAMSFSEVPRVDAEKTGARFEISRNEIAQSLPGLRQMLEESNSSENIAEGKPDGFALGRLRARDPFFRIGLRTGDVIKSVDGEAVDGPEDAELLVDRLAEGGDFSILVERRGQVESLNLSIK